MGNTKSIMKKCMEENKKTVQVLMSTFNGEKYLEQQIDSILNQDFDGCIKLLVRDDGSTDNTVKILRHYEKNELVDIIYGENLGVNESILYLLKNRDRNCSYFAFSDQDDVWNSDKIRQSVFTISKEANNLEKPILFASSTYAVDKNLKPLNIISIAKRKVSFYNAMVENIAPGHTQLFNNSLADIVLRASPKSINIIDWWFYIVATAFGNVYFFNSPTVLYRQHGKNVIGYKNNFFIRTLYRCKRMFGSSRNMASIQIDGFYKEYKKLMPEEYLKEIKRYFSCQKNIFLRFGYAVSAKAYRQSRWDNMIFKILYIMGKYKL